VALEWNLGTFADLERVRILRRSASDGPEEFGVVADSLGPSTRTFLDTGVVNDSTYVYSLEILFENDPAPTLTRTTVATPGSRVVWVLDQRQGGPTLVSPDGRRQVVSPGTGTPSDMDVHPATGEVVAVDFFDQRIERFNRRGALVSTRTITASPLSVALVGPDSSIWIGIYDPTGVTHLSQSLTTTLDADSLSGVPEDLAYDSIRASLWVADSEGRLLHRRPNGTITAIEGFTTPFSVAVDPVTGNVWLADRLAGTVSLVDGRADTVIAASTSFVAPFQVILDPDGGGAWVTDSAAGRIVRLDTAGEVATSITALRRPTGIAIDPGTGDLWVTDAAENQLVRLSPTGEIKARLTGFSGPFAVGVADPGDD
jgi:DNA-binding beta-propeller fold protein YncE